MNKQELFKLIHEKLIISCQALPGEPLYDPDRSIMPYMALAAKRAGSPMIRANSVRDIIEIKRITGLPIIGIIKRKYDGFDSYITPTIKEVDQLVEIGTEIIAVDCTRLKRGDGRTSAEYIRLIKDKYPEQLFMADISDYDEGIIAWENGIDLISTTMSGYTSYSPQNEEPDFELIKKLSANTDVPVIAEGKIHTPDQAVQALKKGAWAVIVGGAITRPLEIAERFTKAIDVAEGIG